MTVKTRTTATLTEGPSFSAEGLFSRFSHLLSPLLKTVGIPQAALTDPNLQVPLHKHCQLMELAAQYHGDDTIGLRIGREVHPKDLGPLGYAILYSPTLLDAIQNFSRYLTVYARGCDMSLEVQGNRAVFTYRYSFAEPTPLERRQEAECTLSMVKHVIEVATGERWHFNSVHFQHSKPHSTRTHEQLFEAPVLFDQPDNQLSFDSSVLKRTVVHAEPRLYDVLEGHLAQVMDKISQETDLVTEVGSLIARSLSNGVPSIDEVASSLCMTKRTLQRRLSDEGILYTEYADNIRRKMALQYVGRTEMPLTEIAFLLGYSHVSAFSRAFRRWTDETPHDYRLAQGNGAETL
ncbi:AraC family transcriptional regulator [Pseudohaliea sp.]|uniref:AraC-like transcriptional regulator QhpR n=1 Tax=Pseudohaliea sp. TaxID=2740289 RepID=UPI0032EF39EA